jgi:hypothetical protein
MNGTPTTDPAPGTRPGAGRRPSAAITEQTIHLSGGRTTTVGALLASAGIEDTPAARHVAAIILTAVGGTP